MFASSPDSPIINDKIFNGRKNNFGCDFQPEASSLPNTRLKKELTFKIFIYFDLFVEENWPPSRFRRTKCQQVKIYR